MGRRSGLENSRALSTRILEGKTCITGLTKRACLHDDSARCNELRDIGPYKLSVCLDISCQPRYLKQLSLDHLQPISRRLWKAYPQSSCERHRCYRPLSASLKRSYQAVFIVDHHGRSIFRPVHVGRFGTILQKSSRMEHLSIKLLTATNLRSLTAKGLREGVMPL